MLTQQEIIGRLERLPDSPWHTRMRLIIGSATFFDAFDSIAIASALPVLVALWSLSSQQVGLMISVGFAGQAIGAILFGFLADRIGRIKAASLCVAIFAIMSLLCAAASDYRELLASRFVQGIGLGGEVPIAATYINEIAKSKGRGRFFLLYECVFLLGILVCSIVGAYLVPQFGHASIFLVGGMPALLIGFLRRWCPESPRWLASRGRLSEAESALARIEHQVGRYLTVPPFASSTGDLASSQSARWGDLFRGRYLRRTIVAWSLWFCSFLVSYGLTTWLPTIYRTIYGIPIQTALVLGVFGNLLALIGGIVCALFIDRIGRRMWMSTAFFVACIPMFILAALGGGRLATAVVLTGLAAAAINTIAISLYLYTPEIYPTRMRALGTSWATFWPRFATITGAYLIGVILPTGGLSGVFFLLAAVSILGGIFCYLGATETRGQILEQISP